MLARIYREPEPAADGEPEIRVRSMGWRESMPPGMLHYPQGLPRWLLIFFHDEVHAGSSPEDSVRAPSGLFIWPPGSQQRYGNPETGWTHSWLQFSGKDVPTALAEAKLPVAAMLRLPGADGRVDVYFRRFFEERSLHAEPHPGVLRHLLYHFAELGGILDF
ncbi:MAG: hypothetical protein ACFB21_16550 [Opitutales bacterium]